ncbi:MAG: peptidyl-prolyl cis-trans isomerase [Bacteroidales bacterium]|nr:peptidyl-prolyl cis-trans isomerase [Bacteroidales bacterium]
MKQLNFLKMFVLASFIMPALFANAQSKLDKQVLMTIGDQDITVKEFSDVYYKNNLKSDVIEKKTVDEYLELFTTFRMKVMEAERMQLDTSAKFQKELAGYRKQLAKPFMSSDDITEELVQEAYQRKLKDIRASHILIRCEKNALPSDTLKAYNKAMDIRKKALAKGADFAALADQYSDDPSAKGMEATEQSPARPGNHGDLGYFSVFDMVYPFETGAYNTKEGEISMPVRSDFGYHIIKVNSVTDALGSIQAAHIFLRLPFDASPEDEAAAKQKADNIYKELKAQDGKNWNEMVAQYTDDKGTISRNGTLSNFTVSRIVPEFIEACKSLEKDQIAKPIRTSYGYHIIKLLDYSGVGSLEKERKALTERIEKDMRSKKSEEVVIKQAKSDYHFKQNDKNLEAFLATIDSTILNNSYEPAANVNMDAVLFSLDNNSTKVSDFVTFIKENMSAQRFISPSAYAYQLYEKFSNKTVMDYADAHLEDKYPEFKALVQEYRDGILLFDLMDREVWDKAVKDTVGLQEFHARNASKYMWDKRAYATVITVTRPESLPQVKALLDSGIELDSLKDVIHRDSIGYTFVRKGYYQKGDNQYVDQTEWKVGVRNEIPSTVDQSTTIVCIRELRGPEPKTLKEARGLVTSDYQVELEQKWVQSLKERYPVKVNENVLDKVRKMYQ